MTNEQTRRVIEAIKECDKIIAREMTYMAQHRNVGLINQTEAHKLKLQAMVN